VAENSKETNNNFFKYRSLKVYASTEWLADNKKKYRQVFYRKDVKFLYIEFAFTNKMFEDENWDINLQLHCYKLGKERKKVCTLNINRQVSKYDDIVYIREGWGNKEAGKFWKKGKYVWEAWIDNEKVGTKYFYVEDITQKSIVFSKDYMSVDQLYFYEGGYDDSNENPTHLIEFEADSTRYVYADIICRNNYPEQEWIGEIILRFINEARELKGQIKKIVNVKKGENLITISGGWGSNVKGSWKPGTYHLEMIFMEQLLVHSTFEIGELTIEGTPSVHENIFGLSKELQQEEESDKSTKEIFKDFHSLIGLKNVKKQIHEHTTYVQFLQLRKERGYKETDQIKLHSIFSGNPGTGKTTVAKLMGSMYRSMGMLKKGHVHLVDRVDLVGEFIGQTAPKVKAAIEKAKGGVLFIDEAYALARNNDDNKDFGKEVIEILVKEMSEPNCDFMVIAAGYPDEMDYFVKSNPGLQSRFTQRVHFEDYSLTELYEILEVAASINEVKLSTAAKHKMNDIITEAFRNKDKHFGNARYVYDLVQKAKVKMGLRLMSSTAIKDEEADIESIMLVDVIEMSKDQSKDQQLMPIDEELLLESLSELNELIGLDKIKEEINDLAEVIRFHKSVDSNPLELGLLEKGHLVEVDRKDLVAGFVGQSALKTANQIDQAMGGVLFIDEAYALTNTSRNDFGDEVIQTLLKRMEDDRGNFFVFAAGYTDNMKAFLKSNPGLSSRFDRTFRFNDFANHELNDIALLHIKKRGYYMSSRATTALNEYITNLFLKKDRYFGNARVIRGIMNNLLKSQNLRLSQIKETNITPHIMKSITLQDVEHMISSQDSLSLSREGNIGFAKSLKSSS